MKKQLQKITLSLFVGATFLTAYGASESPADPTQMTPALREALQAVQSERHSVDTRSTNQPVRLRGRIVRGERVVAVISIGEAFYALRVGDMVTHGNQRLVVRQIDAEVVILNETQSNRVFTLR